MDSEYKVGSISEIIAQSCGVKIKKSKSSKKSDVSSYDPNLCQLFSNGVKDKKKKSQQLTPKLIKTSETFSSSSKTKILDTTPKSKTQGTLKPKDKLNEKKLTHKEAAAFRLQKKSNPSGTKISQKLKSNKPILKKLSPKKNKKNVSKKLESDEEDDDIVDKDDDIELEEDEINSDSGNEESDQVDVELEAKTLDDPKDKKSISFKELNAPKEKDVELESRTLFIGNVPKDVKKSKLKKLFSEFGSIECVRFRCAAPAKPTTLKKIAIRKNEIHPDRNSIVAYVRFSTREEAEKAGEGLNGFELNEHHLTVNLADIGKKERDNKKAVFIGNLHLKTSDDELWTLFQDCGKISGVRIIRDSATGLGKGFGYVNFEDSGSVENALKFDGTEIRGRELRVSRAVKKLKSKDGKKKSQGQRQRKEPSDSISSATGRKESFSGDYLSEIGKLKRKGNKFNRGDMKKARIAQQLGSGSSNTFPRAKTKFFPKRSGEKNHLQNPTISRNKPFKGSKPKTDHKHRNNNNSNFNSRQRGSKPRGGKRR